MSLIGLPMLWTRVTSPPDRELPGPSMAASDAFQQPATVTATASSGRLMLVSVGLALAGILFARFWYKDMSRTEKRLQDLKAYWRPVHTLSSTSTSSTRLYHATVIRGFMALTRALAWFDLRVVDGLVNATSHALKAVAAVGGYIDRLIVDGAVNLWPPGARRGQPRTPGPDRPDQLLRDGGGLRCGGAALRGLDLHLPLWKVVARDNSQWLRKT